MRCSIVIGAFAILAIVAAYAPAAAQQAYRMENPRGGGAEIPPLTEASPGLQGAGMVNTVTGAALEKIEGVAGLAARAIPEAVQQIETDLRTVRVLGRAVSAMGVVIDGATAYEQYMRPEGLNMFSATTDGDMAARALAARFGSCLMAGGAGGLVAGPPGAIAGCAAGLTGAEATLGLTDQSLFAMELLNNRSPAAQIDEAERKAGERARQIRQQERQAREMQARMQMSVAPTPAAASTGPDPFMQIMQTLTGVVQQHNAQQELERAQARQSQPPPQTAPQPAVGAVKNSGRCELARVHGSGNPCAP